MPRPGVNEISQTERAIIVGKLQSGLKQKLIAQQHGISPSAVSKIKYKFIRTADVKNLPRSGRPKVTTDAEDRRIEHLASRQRRLTSKISIQNVFSHIFIIFID